MAVRQPQSGPANFLRALIGVLLLVAAHYTIRPIIGGRAQIDFLLIAVLFTSVRVRPGVAALCGLLAGIIVDSIAFEWFGAGAISFTVIAYVASWLRAVFFADHVALTALFVFLGKWLFDAIYLVVSHRSGSADLVVQLLLWTPLAAALTAVVAVLLLTLFRPLYRTQTA